MPIIDCDIHNVVPSVKTLAPYLSAYWREVTAQTAFTGPSDTSYPAQEPLSARPGSLPASGAPPGSDLALLRSHVLDDAGAELAILNCAYAIDSIHNPYAAAAFAAAVNDWQVAEWLDREPRLRASLLVPVQAPDLAVQEIERRGSHPGFVQVLLPAHSAAPYGNRRYFPIYAAAGEHNLAIGIHYGGSPGSAPTPSGWPSSFMEEYVNMASIFQSQVLSLVSEGVCEQFPALRVVLLEGGFTWLPSLLWRLDKEWKGLRREVPWVKRLPSEVVRAHMRLTTAPLDAPPQPAQLLEVIQQLGSDDLLLYASDYPHWHADSDEPPFTDALPEPLRSKIMSANARDFYHL